MHVNDSPVKPLTCASLQSCKSDLKSEEHTLNDRSLKSNIEFYLMSLVNSKANNVICIEPHTCIIYSDIDDYFSDWLHYFLKNLCSSPKSHH